jgi:hypothetical protein
MECANLSDENGAAGRGVDRGRIRHGDDLVIVALL